MMTGDGMMWAMGLWGLALAVLVALVIARVGQIHLLSIRIL
ncbi:hypothetical protein [Paracoccus sediminis]|nr:hypothetical protein [Paracoccus sediminis]